MKVESGDQVSKGDVLAVVNMTSVYQQIESVQEEIEDLDTESNTSKEDTAAEEITAKVSGRVKEIYAAKGDQVSEVMLPLPL